MLKKLLILVIIAGLAFGAYKVFSKKNMKVEVPSLEKFRVIKTAKVQKKDIWETVEASGEIHGGKELNVYPFVVGKVREITKPTGSEVDKDEALIFINPEDPSVKPFLTKANSPLKGIITRYFVKAGQTVFPGFPLAEVASIENIRVVVQASEKDFYKISPDEDAYFYVSGYPKTEFKGKVKKVSALNSETKTAEVEIVAQNLNYKLRPGMKASVEIFVRRDQNSLVVPLEAVVFTSDSENTLFVVGKGNTVEIKIVKIGLENRGLAQVVSGLNEGDEVVTQGQSSLKNGSKLPPLTIRNSK